MNIAKPAQLFEQLVQIQRMERGKLSVMRQGPEGTYYKHQAWENGKNLSRYVPSDQAAAVQEAIDGYHKFQELTEHYAQQVIDQTRAELAATSKKKEVLPPFEILLAQDQEIQQLMAHFQAAEPNGVAVQQLEVLIRTAIFKPANALVGFLLQAAADRIDAAYQPKPGQHRKGREFLHVNGLFGTFEIQRDYYYHEGKKQGHYPADAALGLEGDNTPALARLVCLEGADETSYQKAENHLRETGGIQISARQIQRLVQPVGEAAQRWQEREALRPEPGSQAVPILYVSGDASGVPMRKAELEGRAGKQPDGSAKTRMAYLGCVFTQHRRDEQGHPVRDYQSTTYVSTFGPIEEFGGQRQLFFSSDDN